MSRVVIRPVGQQGIPGEGVPDGGTTGQILAKASNADYATEWVDNDPDGVQSVTGDGVGGTASDVVLTFPTPAEIGAYPDTNPDGFVDASGASAAAPVQSVNGDTGVVVLDAGDVGAIPTSEKGVASGVASLGADGVLVEDTDYAALYTPNAFYGPSIFGVTTSTFAVNANVPMMSPMMIWRDIEINQLTFSVITNGGVGSTCRIALYQENKTTGLMEIVSGSDILLDTSSNGQILTTVDCSLKKGVLWVLFAVISGASSVVFSSYVAKPELLYKSSGRIYLSDTIAIRALNDDVSAGFPATFTKILSGTGLVNAPLIYFRIKS